MVWRPLFLISSFSSLLERLGRERKDLDAHLALVRWKSRRPEALAPFYVRLSKRKKKKTKRELWELDSPDSVARRTRLLAVTNYFNSRSSQDPKVSQSAPIGILLQMKTPWNRLIRTVKCCYKLLFGHRRLFCLSASVSAAAEGVSVCFVSPVNVCVCIPISAAEFGLNHWFIVPTVDVNGTDCLPSAAACKFWPTFAQ